MVNELNEAHYVKSRGKEEGYDWWMEILTEDPKWLANAICDRFFFSELVYGPIFRGKLSINRHQAEVILSLIETAQPLIIRTKLIADETLFNNRPQDFDWERMEEVDEDFHHVLKGFDHIILNPLHEDATEEVMALSRFDWNHKRPGWIERRTNASYGRGNLDHPQWMFVGEKFSTINKWMVPFERSRSGRTLHTALRRIQIPLRDCWFTNAYKEEPLLTHLNIQLMRREIETVQPQRIIALGSRASTLLSIVDADHCHVYHPGYFHYRASEEKAVNLFTDVLRAGIEIFEREAK